MVGKKFVNNQKGGKNYGRVATVAKYDDIAKHVTLMFDDGTGGCDVSTSTLKRWWKKFDIPEEVGCLMDLDNPVSDEEAEQISMVTGDKALEQSVVASDGTPYTEVMNEIIEDGKKIKRKVKMKEKVKKERKETVPAFDSQSLREFVIAYCENTLNGTITERKKGNGSSMSKVALKVEGHMFATMSWSKKAVSINVRSSVEYDTPTKVYNNTIFGAHYIVSEDTKTVRTMVTELLEKAVDDQLNRKSTKKNKEDK